MMYMTNYTHSSKPPGDILEAHYEIQSTVKYDDAAQSLTRNTPIKRTTGLLKLDRKFDDIQSAEKDANMPSGRWA
jgi:hypothetical protein